MSSTAKSIDNWDGFAALAFVTEVAFIGFSSEENLTQWVVNSADQKRLQNALD